MNRSDDDTLLARLLARGGWVDVKTIHGRRYVYLRYRDGKRKRSVYVGKAEDVELKKKKKKKK